MQRKFNKLTFIGDGMTNYVPEEEIVAERMKGYHLNEIKKGKLGELSKIQEELDEAFDAEQQKSSVMVLLELADLYGALDAYLFKNFPDFIMDDLAIMSRITERAFESGERK